MEATDSIAQILHSTSLASPNEHQIMLAQEIGKEFQLFLKNLKTKDNISLVDKLKETHYNNEMTQDFIWFNVKPANKFCTGRNVEIQLISKFLLESYSNNYSFFIGITGLGGIGKSEVAKMYAKIFYKEIKGHCVWINAETTQTSFDSFCRLAAKLGISTCSQSNMEKTFENLVFEILELICKHKSLFIFDNLENYDSKYLKLFVNCTKKLAPDEIRPFVILTSRCNLVNPSFGNWSKQIDLNVLSEEAALSFFVKALDVKEDENSIANLKTISEKLMYFPLAMQQTVAYLNSKKRYSNVETEIKDYLIAFEKKSKELLTFPLPTIIDTNSKTTFVTWKITLEKIENFPGVGTKARDTLRLVSFLNSDNISIEFINKLMAHLFPEPIGFFAMLVKRFKLSTENDVDVIQILDDYSMVKKLKLEERFVISIHRLVQEVTRIQMEEKFLLNQLLDRLLEVITKLLAHKEIPLREMIHIESVWNHAAKSDHLSKKYQQFPEAIYQKYFSSGRYREALEYWSVPYDILKLRFGEGSRRNLEMIHQKGTLLEKTGAYDKALETLELVYEMQKKNFGDTDHDSLKSAGYIAQVHWRKQNYSTAIQCFQNVIKKREQMCEKDTDDILNLKISQGLVLVDQGNHDDALKIYSYVLPLKENRHGKDSLATLPLLNNIAQAKFEQEKYEEALQEFIHVLHLREQLLEVDHLSTLRTRFWITEIYSRLGRIDEALKFGKETYEKQKCVIGDGHPLAVRTKKLIVHLKNLSHN